MKDEDGVKGIPLMPTAFDDRTKFNTLIRIVSAKIHNLLNGYTDETVTTEDAKKREDLVALGTRIVQLQERHDHSFRDFLDAKFSLPGMSWMNLEMTFNEINPGSSEYNKQSIERMLERSLHGYGRVLGKVLYEPIERVHGSYKYSLAELEKEMRKDCERIYEKLWLRLGTTRSNLALIHRY